MLDLLITGIHRYLKSLSFWVLFALTILLGIYTGNFTNTHFYAEEIHFIGLFMIYAILVSLAVGTEFSGGGVRNKVIAGYKKGTVYISEILLSLIVSTVLFIVFTGIYVCFNAHSLAFVSVSDRMLLLIGFFLMNMAVSVISTTICFFSPYKAIIAVIINLVILFGGYFASSELDRALNQPEYLIGVIIHEDGTEEEDNQPNPHYIPHDTVKWQTIHAVYYMTPTGQLTEYVASMYSVLNEYQRDQIDFSDLHSTPYYSLAAIGIFLTAGYVFFRKKDLK